MNSQIPEVKVERVPKTQKTELRSVQVLRAIAASSVVFYHVPFIRRGSFGVDIFFVISGFIIAYISAVEPKYFLIKRIIRVVPLYWLGTLGVFMVAVLFPGLLKSTTGSLSHLMKSLLFVPYVRADRSIQPLLFLGWTLEYEMFFYCLFAACLAFGQKLARPIACLSIATIVILGRFIPFRSTIIHFFTRPIILEFAIGIVAFGVWKRYKHSLQKIPLTLACLGSLLAYLSLFVIDAGSLRSYLPGYGGITEALLRGASSLCLSMCFLSMEGKFRFPVLALLIGDASYSLYLLHPYVLQPLFSGRHLQHTVSLSALGLMVVGVTLSFVLAILSFRFVERPSNHYLRAQLLENRGRAAVS